ncbi:MULTISPECIES: TIGR02221 family CRISPR-associated protein [Pseudanabaena]|uniref:CRISPR-associated protein, Csx2 family n=2 Tax=Pseudanabaena TaxID=1152 RepID=L8N3D6_9CYAN|nr:MULTISPECIES: TIGR02221 family CRISPR-associated protein [Pseudanabaena]ELS34191.1 CRISPR-associated protein, Csx2 family [Pseudanabaena biceps PCC 7429]MDG3493606.1 TIGR02221 family CRISPR-associated protein [Pseudanabaena catenata USMAC16]
MTTVVTFLGDRGLLETKYRFGDHAQSYTGGVFAEALVQFCEFDRMIVCVTEKAKLNTWSKLVNLHSDPRIQALDIPTGIDTSEMWQTFEIIAAEIPEGESVIFDITHGLRSLPFLVFLFAAYFKAAKNVTIKSIYYGALELRAGEIAPVIDLSEFISMIDWITATTRFTEMGNGQALVDLLRNEMPTTEELRDRPDWSDLSGSLENTASAIETISLALSITRPIEVMASASKLEATLKRSADAFGQRARPFQLLSDRVVAEYGQFALERPIQKDVIRQNLEIQRETIEWYIERNYIVQALTLAREWLVSVVAYWFDLDILDYRGSREPIEDALHRLRHKFHPKGREFVSKGNGYFDELVDLPNARAIATLWKELANLRNDLAHCGMNKRPMLATKMRECAMGIGRSLIDIEKSLLD